MKHFLYLLVFIPCFSFAQQFNFFEGSTNLPIELDTGVNQVWQVGRPQKSIFDASLTLPNALITDTINTVQGPNRSSFQFRAFFGNPFNLPFYVVVWKQKTDFDVKKAGGILETSFDDGASWVNVKLDTNYRPIVAGDAIFDTLTSGEIGLTGTDSSWRGMMLCWQNNIGSPVFPPNNYMHVRFTYYADANAMPKEGWMIDDLETFYTIVDANKPLKQQELLAVKVFPNPTKDFVNVEVVLEKAEHVDLQVHSLQGSLVYSSNLGELSPGFHTFKINNDQLPAGSVFFLTTKIGESIQVRRLSR